MMRVPLVALLGVTFVLACTVDPATGPTDLNGPEFTLPPAQVTGTLTGPDGTNLCNFYPPSTRLIVRLYVPGRIPLTTGGGQTLVCPTNSYAVTAAADTYAVSVLPSTTTFGTLPARWLDTALVDNTGGAAVRDVQVLEGQPLTGSVTRSGIPVPDAYGNITYASLRTLTPTGVITDAGGAWTESFGRSPVLLQAGQRYLFGCPPWLLGSRIASAPPSGGLLFPGEITSFGCTFDPSDEIRFTHGASRLAVTAMPGDIGGVDGPSFGWGVQFPVAPGNTPAVGPIELSELFRGGLVIAIAPDRMLTGYSAYGFALCGGPANDACKDLTPIRHGQIAHQGATGRKIMWETTDARSPEGVGINVRQRSYDRGDQGGDFVWFEFRIENTSKTDLTLFAGFWGDWDIGLDATEDFGETAMDRHLMFFHNRDGSGPYVGSLLVGPAPVAGNFVYVDAQNGSGLTTLARQFELASGAVTSPTTLQVGDQRAYHTIGPITIRKKGDMTFWVAIVAGNTQSEMMASVQAALAARPTDEN